MKRKAAPSFLPKPPKRWIVTDKVRSDVFEAASKGLCLHDIAKTSGATYQQFMAKKAEFKQEYDAGRSVAFDINTDRVENSLMKMCLGHEFTHKTKYDKVVFETHKGKRTPVTVTLTKEETEYIPPNITAVIFFLCNKASGKWKSINREEFRAFDNISEKFSQIADAITRSDTGAAPLLPG
jgi:hypothetical protein